MTRSILPSSLRFRFLLAISLWVFLGITAIWISAVSIFSAHVEQSYHEELEVHVRELGRLTEIGTDGTLALSRPLSDPRFDFPLSGFYWQVTSDGRPALRSGSMTRGRLSEDTAQSLDITHRLQVGPTGPAITYGFARRGQNGALVRFVMATDQRELDRLIDTFTRDLTAWLVGLGLLLLATGLAIISFGLSPLDRLARAFGQLRRGETDELTGHYPAEIAPLAADLNAYIRQNEAMLSRARVQAGNLAHSLRTPLAIITDEAERMSGRAEGQAAAAVLLGQAKVMEQQIEYQLARARSSVGKKPSGRGTAIPEAALPILKAMERLHPEKTFAMDAGGCKGIILPLDPVDFSEVLSILLDNAGKWARQHVTLSFVRDDQGGVTTRIEDDGPGIPDHLIEEAFEVGTRFDQDAPGSGLGLPIAREMCHSLGLGISLRNHGGGLLATLSPRLEQSSAEPRLASSSCPDALWLESL
jgi:signal transduction histidine kinase